MAPRGRKQARPDGEQEAPGSMKTLVDYLRAEWSDETITEQDLTFVGCAKSRIMPGHAWYWRIAATTEMYAFICRLPDGEILYGMDKSFPAYKSEP